MGFEQAALKRATEPAELPSCLSDALVGCIPTAKLPVPKLSAARQFTEIGIHHHIDAVSIFHTTKQSFLPLTDPAAMQSFRCLSQMPSG